jgi:hypothetical protein
MVKVTQVLCPSTPVMRYESKHLPSLRNLVDACKVDGVEKICILWECQYFLP